MALDTSQEPASKCQGHQLSRPLTQLSALHRKVFLQEGPLLNLLRVGGGFLVHSIYAFLDGHIDQGVLQLHDLTHCGRLAAQVLAEVDGLPAQFVQRLSAYPVYLTLPRDTSVTTPIPTPPPASPRV